MTNEISFLSSSFDGTTKNLMNTDYQATNLNEKSPTTCFTLSIGDNRHFGEPNLSKSLQTTKESDHEKGDRIRIVNEIKTSRNKLRKTKDKKKKKKKKVVKRNSKKRTKTKKKVCKKTLKSRNYRRRKQLTNKRTSIDSDQQVQNSLNLPKPIDWFSLIMPEVDSSGT